MPYSIVVSKFIYLQPKRPPQLEWYLKAREVSYMVQSLVQAALTSSSYNPIDTVA